MGHKAKVSAKGTYILDEDDVEQLDGVSLTSVMGDVAGSIEQPEGASPGPSPDPDGAVQGDTTINRLLREESVPSIKGEADRGPLAARGDAAEQSASTDLIAAELLFPEGAGEDDS